jgi:hypothetical protein
MQYACREYTALVDSSVENMWELKCHGDTSSQDSSGRLMVFAYLDNHVGSRCTAYNMSGPAPLVMAATMLAGRALKLVALA